MNNFLDNIYGVIFAPGDTFDKLIQTPEPLQSVIIVAIISIIRPLLDFKFSVGAGSIFLLGLQVFSSAIGGIISWLIFASFIEVIASIFNQSRKIKQFLCLSAFALVPWIFIAPAELFKLAGVPGGVFGILLGLGIWLWVTVLIINAVIKAYNLSFRRSVTLLIIPFFAGFLAFNWITGFFITLFDILKI